MKPVVPGESAANPALARRNARYSTLASPNRCRSNRSSPPIGYRFCGAGASLCGVEANRGRVSVTRSASAVTVSVVERRRRFRTARCRPKAPRPDRGAGGTTSSTERSGVDPEHRCAFTRFEPGDDPVEIAGQVAHVMRLDQTDRIGKVPAGAEGTVDDDEVVGPRAPRSEIVASHSAMSRFAAVFVASGDASFVASPR